MKKILVLAPYCSLPGEFKFNRFMYIAKLLSDTFDVTLATSSFRHFDKTQRKENHYSEDYAIKMIYEPGYKKNVSFSRVFSHKVFCDNFKSWFNEVGHEFDIVYSAYPLIETNVYLGKIKNKLHFKLILDVQDIWPEAISAALPFVKSFPIDFLPFTQKANKAYSKADALISVSDSYMNRAIKKNATKYKEVVYIGSELGFINHEDKKKSHIFKLIYIGSLGYSYDLKTIIIAVNELYDLGYDIQFDIYGGGMQESDLRKIAGKAINFNGFVPYEEMVKAINIADAGVNCLKKSAPQSVTNKLSDYMSIGIPILNGQANNEVIELLSEYSDHENYESENIDSAKRSIISLYERKDNIRFRPCSKFDRSKEYLKIKNIIEELLRIN
ncbi:glycosyltransferase [Vibrio harveyi]